MNPIKWSVRVRTVSRNLAEAALPDVSLSIGPALDFDARRTHASAFELLLSAFGADLLNGFTFRCDKQRLQVDAAEIAVQGQCENPLVFLDVVGESGSPATSRLDATLYVTSPESEVALQSVWEHTVSRSPLHATMVQCAEVNVRLVVM